MAHPLDLDHWYQQGKRLSYQCRCTDEGEPKPRAGTLDHRVTPGRINRARERLDFWIELPTEAHSGRRFYKKDPYDVEYVERGPTSTMTVELWWVYRRAQMVLARELRTAEKLSGQLRHNDTFFWSEAKAKAEALSFDEAWSVGERC